MRERNQPGRTGKPLQAEGTACVAGGGWSGRAGGHLCSCAWFSVAGDESALSVCVSVCTHKCTRVCTCLGVESLPRDGPKEVNTNSLTSLLLFFGPRILSSYRKAVESYYIFSNRERLIFLKRSLAATQFFLRLDYVQWPPLRSSPAKDSSFSGIR